jgi:hypothetical protein
MEIVFNLIKIWLVSDTEENHQYFFTCVKILRSQIVRTLLLSYDSYYIFSHVKHYWIFKSKFYIVQKLLCLQYKHQNLSERRIKNCLFKNSEPPEKMVLPCGENVLLNWKRDKIYILVVVETSEFQFINLGTGALLEQWNQN